MQSFFRIIPVLCLISACAMPNETFDCPHPKGIGCASVTEVNTLINHKILGDTTHDIDQNIDSVIPTNVSFDHQAGYRVWIAPYVDEDGTLHPSQIGTL